MKFFRFLTIGPLALTIFSLAQAQSVEPKSTVITSDGPAEMVSTDKETTFTFKDHVVVTGTNMKMNCDYLEIVVLRSGDQTATVGKTEKFKSMLATGNVLMVMGDREAACGRAEVLPGEEKVVLSEHPVIVDHDQNTRGAGKKITLLRGQRRVLIEEPEITAPPVKDLGVDKEAKPAAGAAPATKEPVPATKESKPANAAPQNNPPTTAPKP
jgi:lipopolysaccharide export system protein LptA